jgi:hypothetical protein
MNISRAEVRDRVRIRDIDTGSRRTWVVKNDTDPFIGQREGGMVVIGMHRYEVDGIKKYRSLFG